VSAAVGLLHKAAIANKCILINHNMSLEIMEITKSNNWYLRPVHNTTGSMFSFEIDVPDRKVVFGFGLSFVIHFSLII
jgi:hypothetical protein